MTTITNSAPQPTENLKVEQIITREPAGYRTINVIDGQEPIMPSLPTVQERLRMTLKAEAKNAYSYAKVSGARRLGRSLVMNRSISDQDLCLLDEYAGDQDVALNLIGTIIKVAGESQSEDTPSGFILLADTLATVRPETGAQLALTCIRPNTAEALRSGDTSMRTMTLAGVNLRGGLIGAMSLMGTAPRTETLRNMAQADPKETLDYLNLILAKWNDASGSYGAAKTMRHTLTRAGYEAEQIEGKVASTLKNFVELKAEVSAKVKAN
jgi:hypothetical protein